MGNFILMQDGKHGFEIHSPANPIDFTAVPNTKVAIELKFDRSHVYYERCIKDISRAAKANSVKLNMSQSDCFTTTVLIGNLASVVQTLINYGESKTTDGIGIEVCNGRQTQGYGRTLQSLVTGS